MRIWASFSVLAAMALMVAGCLETTSNHYVVYEPGTSERAKTASASEHAKVQSKQMPSAAAKNAVADSVRADLRGNCLLEHGGLLGGGETVTKQCDCYATGMVKTMGKDDLDLYAQYKVLSTLSVARPEDVKKQCGFQHIPSSRGKLPPQPNT
jgi:hypothetical protein